MLQSLETVNNRALESERERLCASERAKELVRDAKMHQDGEAAKTRRAASEPDRKSGRVEKKSKRQEASISNNMPPPRIGKKKHLREIAYCTVETYDQRTYDKKSRVSNSKRISGNSRKSQKKI